MIELTSKAYRVFPCWALMDAFWYYSHSNSCREGISVCEFTNSIALKQSSLNNFFPLRYVMFVHKVCPWLRIGNKQDESLLSQVEHQLIREFTNVSGSCNSILFGIYESIGALPSATNNIIFYLFLKIFMTLKLE